MLVFRFLIPAVLALFSFFLLPYLPSGFRFVNHEDVPGIYLSLCMLPLLIPAAIFTMFKPRLGGPSLAVVGGLGVAGKLLSPSTFRTPFYLGLGPFMYFLALASGVIIAWRFRMTNRSEI